MQSTETEEQNMCNCPNTCGLDCTKLQYIIYVTNQCQLQELIHKTAPSIYYFKLQNVSSVATYYGHISLMPLIIFC